MEGGYDASSTVGNQSLDTRDSLQQEVTNPDRIYQQQQSQQQQPQHQIQMQNQPSTDRPTEIPAAKVQKLLLILSSYLAHTLKFTNTQTFVLISN